MSKASSSTLTSYKKEDAFLMNSHMSVTAKSSAGLYQQVVWTVPTSGMDCTNKWYGLYQQVVWTVPTSGMDCINKWYGLYQQVVWTVPTSGMDCTNKWYGLYQQVVWVKLLPGWTRLRPSSPLPCQHLRRLIRF